MVRKNTPLRAHRRNSKTSKFSALEKFLQGLARVQKNHTVPLAIIFVVFTIVMAYGVSMISFESDMNNEMPRHLPIYQLNDKVTDTFGGQDAVMVLFEIDQNFNDKHAINDIRDADMMRFLIHLQSLLGEESLVDSVVSPGVVFASIPDAQLTDDVVVQTIKQVPQAARFFSDDYTATLMVITADVGSGEGKLDELTAIINENIASVATVPGVMITVTGTPSVMQTILHLLQTDSLFTLIVAGLIILCLLFIIERSFIKSILIFLPLSLGIIWTLGTMGFLGLKISIATAGLGAMLLGLGVEYGVFMLTRYDEERKKGNSQGDALFVAVPSVGSAMLGSGLTTIVGFLALSFSVMPMLQHLGQSLALGIVFCLVAAIFLAPVVFILQENFVHRTTHNRYHRYRKKVSEVKK